MVSEQTTNFNRREALALAGAAAFTATAVGAAQAVTPVIRLYREYLSVKSAETARFLAHEDEDSDIQEYLSNTFRLEAEMMAAPCETPACFAAKVLVDTANGSQLADWNTGPLWAEARALVGGVM